jgi:hypothetical protein
MTLIAALTTPRFDDHERTALHRLEGILARHPYMRADLGASTPLGAELENVLSARLGLLHAEGAKAGATSPLARKLHECETELAAAVAEDPGSEKMRMRYETTLLLHPAPDAEHTPAAVAARRAELTAMWERSRANRPAKVIWRERFRQSGDFFRHGAMLPFYWARRRRVRRLVPRSVLAHRALRETYFAIEQVGPLVDNFAFRGAGGLPLSIDTALADIAFLYMQLADEFLDELAAAAGGHDAAGELVRAVYCDDTSKRPLASFTLIDLQRRGLDPDAHATKFGLSLSDLFARLDELARVMDDLLATATAEVVHATHLFLHHCFQTYLDEVELCETAPERRADRLPLSSAAWHFYRKNNMVMMLWLDLRARLLGLSPSEHAGAIRRWGYLLAAFQIFDDLKDIALDLGKQPSYPLQIAASDFPKEFVWLERRFGARRTPVTRDEVLEVTLRANRTVRQCMQWSRLMALAHFDNTLLYAWDQRWRKSWTRRRRSFNPIGSTTTRIGTHAVDRLVRTLLATRVPDLPNAVDDEQLAFALDASAYDGSWQIYLALFPNLRAMYRFATLRMLMSAEEKARAARRLLRRYPRARASALLDLADADVHHQVAGDGLEAFAKLIEV